MSSPSVEILLAKTAHRRPRDVYHIIEHPVLNTPLFRINEANFIEWDLMTHAFLNDGVFLHREERECVRKRHSKTKRETKGGT